MSELGKINIYVPARVDFILSRDASLFEIYKKGGQAINKNRFLSLLIIGYYDAYAEERHTAQEKIKAVLSRLALSRKEVAEVTDNLINSVIMPEIPKRKGKNPAKLSLKPTSETEGILSSIINDLAKYDFVSQYLCKMFISYCQKPLFERERIIFNKNYELLKTACDTHRPVSLTTIWNNKVMHEVCPYKISVGQDEMFNYLLCQEDNQRTGIPEARTYRLSRIAHLKFCTKTMTLDPDVERHLEKMQEYGAAFSINTDDDICVKLNDYGVLSYNRVYHGRPTPYIIENEEDGYYYYFDCSKRQILQYFRRFEPGAAEIISPEDLRRQMISFHKESLQFYGSDNNQ